MMTLRDDAQPWPHGRCEAGLPIAGYREARWLPPCGKRGRWLVGGMVLCGGCKRTLETRESSREAAAFVKGAFE